MRKITACFNNTCLHPFPPVTSSHLTPAPRGALFEKNQPLLAGLELTTAQRQTAHRVHASIAADFALRRRMLLKRCDVTVQSFLRDSAAGAGGKKTQGRGGAEAGGAAGGGGSGDDGKGDKFANLPPELRVRRLHTLAMQACSSVCV